jgi:hypothetical protein
MMVVMTMAPVMVAMPPDRPSAVGEMAMAVPPVPPPAVIRAVGAGEEDHVGVVVVVVVMPFDDDRGRRLGVGVPLAIDRAVEIGGERGHGNQ